MSATTTRVCVNVQNPMEPAKIESIQACDICGLGLFCFIQPASGFEAAGTMYLISNSN